MRRIPVVLSLVLAAGCTPGQREAWLVWFEADPHAAVTFALDGCGDLDCSVAEPSSPDSANSTAAGELSGMAQCSEWADEAWAAGWRSEGYDLGRVMYAESRCQPGAYNSQEHFGGHATGLMQIIDPTWPNETSACQGGLFDPVVNLRCALWLRNNQGWDAWVTY